MYVCSLSWKLSLLEKQRRGLLGCVVGGILPRVILSDVWFSALVWTECIRDYIFVFSLRRFNII